MNFIREINWRPTIGDPSFMGWFTVFAYAVAAVLAARVWQRDREKIWLWVTIGMTALCINKQLDLQSLLTAIGRVLAWHEGWFEQRREFQKWFILGALAIAGLIGTGVLWRFHAFWLKHKLLFAGGLFLLTFIAVRAVSFHHVDVFLNSSLVGMRMNCVLELTGISLVGLATVREPSLSRKRS